MMNEAFVHRAAVLVCDDTLGSDASFRAAFDQAGIREVTTLADPGLAPPALRDRRYDLIVLDLEASPTDGLALLNQLHHAPAQTPRQPVLVIVPAQATELRHQALALGATDFLPRPFDSEALMVRVRNALHLRAAELRESQLADEIEARVEARTAELTQATDAIAHRLAQVCEMGDHHSEQHIRRIGKLAHILAHAAGLPPEQCFLIEHAAPLHDVGKLGVSDDILLKSGQLSAQEFDHVKRHTQFGKTLLDDPESTLVNLAASIANHHHERWDGTGYPNGLRGEAIPIEGRILAICDVFDALISTRPYKDPWSVQNAVDYLVAQAGHSFDPVLVAHFIAQLSAVEAVLTDYPDTH